MKKRHIRLISCMLATLIAFSENHSIAQVVTDSNWMADVKTVTLTKNGVVLEAPVLQLGGSDRLMLRFDVLGAEADNYRYRIQHCDSRWQADQMQPHEYISGFEEGPIENYSTSFTTLQDYVNYFQYIPGEYGRLLLSGNYVVTVFREDEPDSILLTRRFCVTEESVKAKAEVATPYDNGNIFERREVNVTIEQNLNYKGEMLPPQLNPSYISVVVQQNGRIDNQRELVMGGYERGALCYRNHPENIFEGGNTFRYFDISNIRTPIYNVARIEQFGAEWYALLKPLEDRSRKPFITETVLNGGMKVNVWDRDNKETEADYVWVNFTLPMDYPFLNGQIHVVGDLTQWQLDEHSRMQYDVDMKAYRLRLHLKQGYYAYQLLFVPVGEKTGHTETLEGNHYETPNDYTIYVYYRTPSERYDRLICLTTIKN